MIIKRVEFFYYITLFALYLDIHSEVIVPLHSDSKRLNLQVVENEFSTQAY